MITRTRHVHGGCRRWRVYSNHTVQRTSIIIIIIIRAPSLINTVCSLAPTMTAARLRLDGLFFFLRRFVVVKIYTHSARSSASTFDGVLGTNTLVARSKIVCTTTRYVIYAEQKVKRVPVNISLLVEPLFEKRNVDVTCKWSYDTDFTFKTNTSKYEMFKKLKKKSKQCIRVKYNFYRDHKNG